MSHVANPSNVSDAARQCLATVLALQGKPVSVSRVAHQFNNPANVNSIELVRAALDLGCQAKLPVVAKYDVTQLPTPCIIEGGPGTPARYCVLAKIAGDQVTLLPKRATPN